MRDAAFCLLILMITIVFSVGTAVAQKCDVSRLMIENPNLGSIDDAEVEEKVIVAVIPDTDNTESATPGSTEIVVAYDGIQPRWSKEKANRWYKQFPWLVGCNFNPSSAINQLEMWQEDTFDPQTIDRELGWAADIGFNTVRVYLHDLLWEEDSDGLKRRIHRYLEIAESHGIKTMFVIFDDCWNQHPQLGKQPDPIPGTHNSGWVQSPSEEIVLDPTKWARLQRYVTELLTAFNGDQRILLWDLYNEPGNQNLEGRSYDLVKKTIEWAQAANPSQPLTIGEWNRGPGFRKLNKLQLAASDVLTFHEYNSIDSLKERVRRLQSLGRPVLCTEYMARTRGSRFENFLAVFKWENVGAYNWGLVSGKTNTIYQWDTVLDHEPDPWFHDIFRKDGKPYREWEVRLIRELTNRKARARSTTQRKLHAQAPAMQWHKGHGTDQADHVHYGLQSGDGGYIMAGQTSESRSHSDMLVVKTDEQGDLQWQKVIGTPRRHDFATFVVEVAGGFVVTGALDVDGQQQPALIKLDADGNIVWQKTHACKRSGSIRGAAVTGDGGLVATGYVGSEEHGYGFIHDGGQGSLLRTDAEGNLQWEKTLPPLVHGMRVHEVAGGYVVSGVSTQAGGDFGLLKTNHAGEVQWHKNYGDDTQEDLFDSDVTTDGGFILAGHKLIWGRVSDNNDIFDYWLVKVDGTGELQWSKTFGQPRGYQARYIRDECYGVKQTSDGGYVMVGGSGDEDSYSASGHPGGPSDIWKSYVVRTDAKGNLLWHAVYGDPAGNNAGEYINLTRDGGYVIFTDSDTAGTMGSGNFGLMKLAPQ